MYDSEHCKTPLRHWKEKKKKECGENKPAKERTQVHGSQWRACPNCKVRLTNSRVHWAAYATAISRPRVLQQRYHFFLSSFFFFSLYLEEVMYINVLFFFFLLLFFITWLMAALSIKTKLASLQKEEEEEKEKRKKTEKSQIPRMWHKRCPLERQREKTIRAPGLQKEPWRQ